jgi:hypothetical protein
MALGFDVPHTHGMPRSSRWLIAAGYLMPFALLGVAWLSAPAGIGEFGGEVWYSLALVGGIVLAALLLLAGVVIGLAALVRGRGQFRGSDHAFLVAGVAPLVALGIGVFW